MTSTSETPTTENPSHEGEGSGDWECYSCLGRVPELTEGFQTKCPFCGSFELHLTAEARS